MNILSVNNLNFKYFDKVIFNNFSFDLKEGTINVVLGTNSSGKTTLVKILSGMLKFDGTIQIHDQMLSKKNIKKYSRLIGVSFYNKFLFQDVISELVFSLENLNFSSEEIKKRLNKICNILEMHDIKNRKISSLSNFEKAKVILASTIIHEPKLIILDELFDELTYNEYCIINDYIKKLIKEYNVTFLYTTNNLDKCLHADCIFFINKGNLILNGKVDYILEHDNTLSKEGIFIPTMIDLSLKLKFYGLVDRIIMDNESLVDILWK